MKFLLQKSYVILMKIIKFLIVIRAFNSKHPRLIKNVLIPISAILFTTFLFTGFLSGNEYGVVYVWFARFIVIGISLVVGLYGMIEVFRSMFLMPHPVTKKVK